MSKIEVLVATMNQNDLSLYKKMNIQTDVIFANQCDKNEFVEEYIDGNRVRMISTTTIGVGINRNLAMQLSNAKYCLCADDDVIYENGYEEIICNEFKKYPKADLIAFNMWWSDHNSKPFQHITKTKQTKRAYGTYCLAYRNTSAKKYNICFSRLFGGGAKYGSGEDSLFCKDFAKKGNLYQTKTLIGSVNHQDSTWFKGYTEKYFFDKGAWVKCAYPKLWRILKYYLVFKLKKRSKFSYIKIIKLFNYGAKSFHRGMDYKEYIIKGK